MGIASTSFIWSFLVATLLGFLIGLEREGKRESTGTIFAGVRTFPLIAVFGAVSGRISTLTSDLLLFASFAAIVLLIGLAYWRESAGHKLGGTTGVAALVAYGLGVLAGLEQYVAALAGAVITTGLLSLRQELRTLIGALTREDLLAVVKFAAVSLVVLPLVPDASLGPWGVWNPRTIWWLVVLISGISFIGYVAVKWIGTRRGMGLSGLLGGLASSTAVTLSFSRLSRLSRDQPALGNVVAVGVIAASAVSAPRLLVLLAVVQPSLVAAAAVPLAIFFGLTTIAGLAMLRQRSPGELAEVPVSNPFELRAALQFGLLFALVLLLIRTADELLGTGGLYLASALSGVAELNAATLSLAEQMGGGLTPEVAARALALAIATNSVFKSLLAMIIAGGSFGRVVALTLTASALATVAVSWLLLPRLFA